MKKIALWAIVALFAASIANSPCVRAQTFDRTFAQSLILAGGGTNTTNALTLTVASMAGPATLTFPGGNVAGLLINPGNGLLSWNTTLPSGLTIPSPTISSPNISNPTFTGTIVLPAGTFSANSLGLPNQNIFVGNLLGDASAVAPTANAVLITDATAPTGTPQWSKTLPSSLSIPSPTISSPNISNPTFSGSVTFSSTTIAANSIAPGFPNTFLTTANNGSTVAFTGLNVGTGLSGNGVGTALTNTGATSVSNSDGTLTISPTSGAVVASLNLAHANTWTAAITDSMGGIGTTQTNGFKAVNAAPSTSTVKVQQSPSYEAGAHVWGNGADSTMAWHITNIPTSATVPTSILRFDEGNGGAGYTPQMSISNTGTLTLGNANGSTGVTGSLALANSGNTNLTTITVPSGAPAITYTLPSTGPSNGQFLQSTSSGGLSWVSSTGGAGGTSIFSGSAHPKFGGNGPTYTFPYGYVHDEGANQNAANVASLDVALINESGTIKNFTVMTDGTNLGSGTAVLTLYDVTAAASTGITVSLTGAATTATDATDSYTIPSGHLLTLEYSGVNSPPGFQAAWAYQFSGSLGSGGLTDPMTTKGDIIYSSDNLGTPARLGIGGSNTVLTGGTTPSYQTLTTNSSLLGNGIGTSFGINLTNANTWTGQQTYSNTTTATAPLVASNTSTPSSGTVLGATIGATGVSTGSAGNTALQLTASGSTGTGGNTALGVTAGKVNIAPLTDTEVVMTDANDNLISSGSATSVAPHTFLLGPISGSSNGAATFRAIDSSDISSSAASKIAAKLAATNSSGVAQLIQNVSATPLTNSTTNLANVTGMSFSIGSNDTMSFQFFVMDTCTYTGTAPTGSPGIQFALTFPTNGTTIYAMFNGTYDNNANGHEHPERIENSGVKSTTVYSELGGMPGGFPLGIMSVYGTIITGASDAGTVQLQFCCSATGYTAEIFPLGTGYAYTH